MANICRYPSLRTPAPRLWTPAMLGSKPMPGTGFGGYRRGRVISDGDRKRWSRSPGGRLVMDLGLVDHDCRVLDPEES